MNGAGIDKRSLRLSLLALAASALCLTSAALAADQTDRSFGQNGIADTPQPPESSGFKVAIWDLANAPRGRMVAAIANVGAAPFFAAARFHQDGSLDTSFGDEGFTRRITRRGKEAQPQAQAVAVQWDGDIVVVGYQEGGTVSPRFAPFIARYRSDGSLDPSFGHGGKVAPKLGTEGSGHFIGGGTLHDVAIEPNGRIVAVGGVDEVAGGRPAGRVIAYRPDGRIDTRFGHDGRVLFSSIRDFKYTALRSVKVLKSGKLLVSGYLHNKLFLARLSANGRLDRSFGDGDGRVSIRTGIDSGCIRCQFPSSLAVDRHGRILVLTEHNVFSPALVRFLPDGALDKNFGEDGFSIARTGRGFPAAFGLAIQRNQRILTVGYEVGRTPNGLSRDVFAARRFLPNGHLDRGFSEAGQQTLDIGSGSAALTALTQPNGRVVAGGLSVEQVPGVLDQATLLMTRYSTR